MLENVKEYVAELKKRRTPRLTLEQYAAKLLSKGLHPDGTPVLDPTPLAPPIGYKKQPSMVEIVRDMVRSERLRQEAESADMETFEESEDFDIPEDAGMPASPWANDFDPSVKDATLALENEKRQREERRKERFEYFEDRAAFQESRKGGAGGPPPAKAEGRGRGAERPVGGPSSEVAPPSGDDF